MILLMKVCSREIGFQELISGGIVFAVLLIFAISVILIIAASAYILKGILI